jgi:hypothetical protein
MCDTDAPVRDSKASTNTAPNGAFYLDDETIGKAHTRTRTRTHTGHHRDNIYSAVGNIRVPSARRRHRRHRRHQAEDDKPGSPQHQVRVNGSAGGGQTENDQAKPLPMGTEQTICRLLHAVFLQHPVNVSRFCSMKK